MPTLSFRVTGRVQHVWFRGWTQMTAHSLGLTGWVRNMPDGSVEGCAQAADDARGHEALKRFQDLLRQGPPSALVCDVLVQRVDRAEAYNGFQVRM
ncbi:acylphosphatase [Humidesulfovibrio mexicanus]|uniref:acylphosphatase n=1 Tax=Humidesulfovibrio mexicanus TaxID=147047 RepID=A0A239DAF2_9BACT|nr:acylphosphatase [Humidesulfovibrio mexicanus]SNS28673.1 acylphosphatase [Humidesulfovibrio mexicanus]